MTRSVRWAFLVIGGLTLAAGSLSAQGRRFVSVGAGATIPTGDYGEYARTGWLGAAAVGTGVGSGNVFVMGSAFYGRNSHEGTDAGSTSLYGALGHVGLMGPGEAARLYGYVGGGLQVHKYNAPDALGDYGDSETQAMGTAAVGVSVGRSATRFWVQGGIAVGDTSYLHVLAGVSVGF